MRIITFIPGHNAAVGLFDNGRCLRVLHEEKFDNIKNSTGFPHMALDALAKETDFRSVEAFIVPVEKMVMAADPYVENNREDVRERFYDLDYRFVPLVGFFKPLLEACARGQAALLSRKYKARLRRYFSERYGVDSARIRHYDHHTCHCLSPLYFYNLKELGKDILLISVDGMGDFHCSRVMVYRSATDKIEPVAASHFFTSPGVLYSAATRFLGMKRNEHEYKVMGLAAYVGKEEYYRRVYDRIRRLIVLDEERLEFQSPFIMHAAGSYLARHCAFERFDNVAAALQRHLEELVCGLVRAAVAKTGVDDVALSGGTFMNVKLNQRIVELPDVGRVWIQPSSGDESALLGAAAKAFDEKRIPLQRIGSMYHGQEYADDEVEGFITSRCLDKRYTVRCCEDVESEIAALLARSEVVGRFSGAGEWGARSLCNRAILANASNLASFHRVNDMIKMRDFWMPFAPTILEEWAPHYIENWDVVGKRAGESFKFMIVTCDSTPLAQDHLSAAIHQKDKTLRPQVCAEGDNPGMYRLLKEFERLTGMGGLMNTSLNMHGYPLVGSLEQALFTFEESGLQHIALGDWLISKAVEDGGGRAM